MNLKKRFEHVELLAKLLNNFLRSNKSNIHQSEGTAQVSEWFNISDTAKESVLR